MIIGQDKILKRIDKLTVDTFPRSLLLVGPEGSGKHSIAFYIKDKLNLPCLDITDNLSQEMIEDIYLKVEPFIYIIDSKNISVKEENTILKFLEEPLKNSFIIILSNNKNLLLPTITNRCQVWSLESYSYETLEKFITQECNKEVILRIANTPGKVKQLQNYNVNVLLELADKIFEKVSVTNFANILLISNRIAFKDEVDKYNFNLFVDILLFTIKNKVLQCNDIKYLQYYNLTDKLCNERNIPHINTKNLFENYLLQLKRA